MVDPDLGILVGSGTSSSKFSNLVFVTVPETFKSNLVNFEFWLDLTGNLTEFERILNFYNLILNGFDFRLSFRLYFTRIQSEPDLIKKFLSQGKKGK